jgi:hypothetical protein
MQRAIPLHTASSEDAAARLGGPLPARSLSTAPKRPASVRSSVGVEADETKLAAPMTPLRGQELYADG